MNGGIFEHSLPDAWKCPVCGVGVRGDVEVCPNCLDRVKPSVENKVRIGLPFFSGSGLVQIEENDPDENKASKGLPNSSRAMIQESDSDETE